MPAIRQGPVKVDVHRVGSLQSDQTREGASMDAQQSTTLAGVFGQVPDPRKARGKRHPWTFIWTIISTAVLCGQRTPHAIAHWAHLHAEELVRCLQPARPPVPSEATIRRALRRIDLAELEHQLSLFTPAPLPRAAGTDQQTGDPSVATAPPAAAGPAAVQA